MCRPAGAGEIFISNSSDLLRWELGEPFITQTSWGNPNVEAGPPPMRLADGNYVFFHNSWGGEGVPQPVRTQPPPSHGSGSAVAWWSDAGAAWRQGYQPAWVVLDGADPRHILARAPAALWRPDAFPWMAGNTSDDTVMALRQSSRRSTPGLARVNLVEGL